MNAARAAASLALPAALAATLPAHAEPAHYTIDPLHTSVHVEWRPAGLATVRARLGRVQGTVTLDRAAGGGSAEIRVDLRSASSGIAAVDAALRSEAGLAAERQPEARFVGERFDAGAGDAPAISVVDGRLEWRGRAQPVSLRAIGFRCYHNLLLGREACGGDFEATIRPVDWGIALPPQAEGAEQFRVLVQVEAIRDAP